MQRIKSRNKRASDSRLVNKTLAPGSLHAESALSPRFLVLSLIEHNARRLSTREEASVALLWRARLLDKLGAISKESGCSGRHANGIKVGKVVSWGSRELVAISRRLLWGRRRHRLVGRRCDLAETLNGTWIDTTATSASRWRGGFRNANERSVDIAQCTRLHTLAALGASAGNDRAVNRIRSFIEPLVFPFTTRYDSQKSRVKMHRR